MNILVTGSKGFIGSRMVQYLRKHAKALIWTDALGDLRDYDVALAITKKMDWVFHFAADFGGVGYFSTENYDPPINNFIMDINMLKACEENKVQRLFYPSSACAYPLYLMNQGKKLSEDMIDSAAMPDQMYGWEKLTMMKLMKYGPLDVRIGILHTIYGIGQDAEGRKAKFPPQMALKAIKAIKTNKIEVWGDGSQTRTFLYIQDAMDKIYKVMSDKKNRGPINIGSDYEISINEVVSICCSILKIHPKIVYDLDKPVGPTRRLCDNTKFEKYYGKTKEIKPREGFRRIIKSLKKQYVQTI